MGMYRTNLKGGHQLNHGKGNNPWQNNIFPSQRPASALATQTEDVPDLGLNVPDLTTTGVTAAPRAFIMRNNEAFSVLSNA
jgi:hypothetical protein